MLAAVFHAPNNIIVQQVSITRRQAMLKVSACAVCGYDVRVFRNGHRKVSPPVILGHELCGQIQGDITVGNGMTINAGSRVAVCPLIPCLHCPYCHTGDYNLCMNLKEIGSTTDGGFAQYVAIPEQMIRIGGLVPVPDNLTDEEAALLEPAACCEAELCGDNRRWAHGPHSPPVVQEIIELKSSNRRQSSVKDGKIKGNGCRCSLCLFL